MRFLIRCKSATEVEKFEFLAGDTGTQIERDSSTDKNTATEVENPNFLIARDTTTD